MIFQDLTPLLSNQALGDNYFRMSMFFPKGTSKIHPGQFCMVRVGEGHDPLLRRPLSVHDYWEDDAGSCLAFLYRVVGRGTEILSQMKSGDELDIIGPLGNGFKVPEDTGKALLVAGGIGVAPFKYLVRHLRRLNLKTILFFGGKNKEDVVLVQDLIEAGVEVKLAAEDGSFGYQGLVTEVLAAFLEDTKPAEDTIIYTCGPEGMLRSVMELGKKYNLVCQVSMEQVMACGLGVCRGCVVAGKSETGYLTVCRDGPVFEAGELI